MPLIFSKRDMEGELIIDHRDSPGITPEQAALAGHGTIPVGAGQIFKTPTRNCAHCTRLVVLNPNRMRARHQCNKCDAYICDECASVMQVTGECRPFKQFLDEFHNWAAKLSSDPTAPMPQSPMERNQKILRP